MLSPLEKEVLDEILERFFLPLKGRETWEGVEVASYWQAVGKKSLLKSLYNIQ